MHKKTPQGFDFTYRKGIQRPARVPTAWKQWERLRTSAGVFSKRRKISPQALFHDPRNARTAEIVRQELAKLFDHVGVPRNSITGFVEETVEMCRQKIPLTELENKLRRLYTERGIAAQIDQSMVKRSEKIFSQIKGHVKGSTVLDIGAGDGKVGELVHRTGKAVTLCDVVDYNKTGLKLVKYGEGQRLPFPDKSFDTSLVLTVFHHSDNPLHLLREAERVTKQRLVVIESIYMTEEHRKMNIFFDWFYNRVLHEGVPVPFNFQHPNQWAKTFRRHGWKITTSKDLGIDQPTVPEHHWLFVVDR